MPRAPGRVGQLDQFTRHWSRIYVSGQRLPECIEMPRRKKPPLLRWVLEAHDHRDLVELNKTLEALNQLVSRLLEAPEKHRKPKTNKISHAPMAANVSGPSLFE